MRTTVALAVFVVFAASVSGQTAEELAKPPAQTVNVYAPQIVPLPQHPRAEIVPIPTWPANEPAPIIPIPAWIEPPSMTLVSSSGVTMIGAPIPWESSTQVPEKIPDNQFPLLPVDRQIDALGTASNIQSPADAETYLNAILAKYKVDTATLPGLSAFAHRLAVAEYAAITDQAKRIPETQLVIAFNQIMDEWGEPQWTRITAEDFHWFHRIKAATLIPYSVSRGEEGNVADTCRPVEAVYLLYMLTTERGLQPDKLPTLPASFGTKPVFMSHAASLSVAPFGDDTGRRETAFLKAENAWMQRRPDPAQQIGRLFDALHIE